LGYQTAISSASGLVGLAISGSIVASHGWHAPFLTYGVFGLSLALLAIIGMPPIELPQAAPAKGFLRALASIWPICVAGILLMMPPLLVTSNAPFILEGLGETSPMLQSVVVSMSTGFAAVSGSVFGRIQARLGVRWTFAGAILCAAAGAILLGTGSNFWMIACGCALTGFGTGLFLPHLWMLSTTLVPEAIQGHAIGLLSTSMFLGGFLYPLLVGGLQQHFGQRGAMVAYGIMLALGAVGIAVARGTRLSGAAARQEVLF
jgi:MFS family permease